MSHYGPLAELVSSVSALGAAGAAITTTFRGRARWQPPEEAVSSGVAKISGLLTAIGIAVLWTYRSDITKDQLSFLAIGGGVLAILALLTAILINVRYSYYWPRQRTEKNRKLGGFMLTKEAENIARTHNHTSQVMIEDAQGSKDLVWTRWSQAWIQVASTFSFIILLTSGSCALAAAGLLIAAKAASSGQS